MTRDLEDIAGLPLTDGKADVESLLRRAFAAGREILETAVEVDPLRAAELARLAAVSYVGARLKGSSVMAYTQAMLDGSWEFSGDHVIHLNWDGTKLVNGLGRLLAVALSGTTQRFTLVRLPDEDLPSWHDGPRVCDVQRDPNAGF